MYPYIVGNIKFFSIASVFDPIFIKYEAPSKEFLEFIYSLMH
jgi:hypothetical protein